MNFSLFILWIWICYSVGQQEVEISYVIDSESISKDNIVILDNHHREKRQVNTPVSTTPLSTSSSSQSTLPPTNTSQSTSSKSTHPSTAKSQSAATTSSARSQSATTISTTKSQSATAVSTTKNQSATAVSTTKRQSATAFSTTKSQSATAVTTTKSQTSATTPSSKSPSPTTFPTTSKTYSTSPSSSSRSSSTPPSTSKGPSTSTGSTASTTPISFTKTFENQDYYTVNVIHDGNGRYWDELVNHTKHEYLSDDKYLTSANVPMSFEMPFYGHPVKRATLTSGGFVYVGPYVHRFLTHSQYVAPLMANFDTKADNSEVLYKDYTNESFVVEFRNIQLNDETHHGQFQFQVKLYKNGTIIFVYKKVPVAVDEISTANHPVKVGLADSFYYDYTRNGVRYRRIYKYHTVAVNLTTITENTVVILTPLPTCNTFTDCDTCVTEVIDFKCAWCPALSKCSDGLDWNYQIWGQRGCNENAGNTTAICVVPTTTSTTMTTIPTTSPISSTATTTPTVSTTAIPTTTAKPTTMPPTSAKPTTPPPTTKPTTTTTPSTTTTTPTTTTTTPTTTTTTPTTTTTTPPTTTTKPTTTTPTTTTAPTTTVKVTIEASGNPPYAQRQTKKKETSHTATIVVPVVMTVLFIALIVGWLYYGYTHPNTRSGQFLIENRPSQLKSKFTDMFNWKKETGEKYRVKHNEDIEIDMQESTA